MNAEKNSKATRANSWIQNNLRNIPSPTCFAPTTYSPPASNSPLHPDRWPLSIAFGTGKIFICANLMHWSWNYQEKFTANVRRIEGRSKHLHIVPLLLQLVKSFAYSGVNKNNSTSCEIGQSLQTPIQKKSLWTLKPMKARMRVTAAWAQKMFCYSPEEGRWGLFETGKLLKISIKTKKPQ